MTLQPLQDWQGWFEHHGYKHADPFSRPLPIPSMGIFDSPDMTICFNSKWSPILLGALGRLTYPELYIVDTEHDGIWATNEAHKIMGVIAGAENPCLPQSIMETECAYYPSWFAGIEYIPHNPFSPSGFDPQYPVAPFFRFANIDTWFPDWLDDIFQGLIEATTGYLENDVFVSFFSLPTYQNPFDGLDYPTIKLTVQGTGTVKMKFLLVPMGGRALISFDPVGVFDILTAIFTPDDRIIELNRDIFAAVPETDVDAIEEIQLTEDGTHEIYVTFLPTLNDEAPIFQFGGGFRGYEVCGNLTVIDAQTGQPLDTENPSYQEGVIVATEQDVYNALVRFETERSNRWLLASAPENIKEGIELDNKGKLEFTDTFKGGVGAPTNASSDEEIYGAAMAVGEGFRDLVAEIVLRRIDQTKPALATQVILSRVFFFQNLDDIWTDLLALLDTPFLDATDTVTPVVIPQAIANKIYCNGLSKQSLHQWAQDIEDAAGTDAEDIANWYRLLIDELADEQIEQWYSRGLDVPRVGFETASCYRFPPEEKIMNYDDFVGGNFVWATNGLDQRLVRLEITVIAPFVDADGDTFDGVYYVPNGGAPVTTFRTRLISGSFHMNATTTPPYINGTGMYRLEYGITNGAFIGTNFNNLAAVHSFAPVSGQLKFKAYDLGEL